MTLLDFTYAIFFGLATWVIYRIVRALVGNYAFAKITQTFRGIWQYRRQYGYELQTHEFEVIDPPDPSATPIRLMTTNGIGEKDFLWGHYNSATKITDFILITSGFLIAVDGRKILKDFILITYSNDGSLSTSCAGMTVNEGIHIFINVFRHIAQKEKQLRNHSITL